MKNTSCFHDVSIEQFLSFFRFMNHVKVLDDIAIESFYDRKCPVKIFIYEEQLWIMYIQTDDNPAVLLCKFFEENTHRVGIAAGVSIDLLPYAYA